MKWIVMWVWLHTVFIPCQHGPQYDEFGRILNENLTTAEACFQTERVPQKRVFDDMSEAISFMTRGMKEKDLAEWQVVYEISVYPDVPFSSSPWPTTEGPNR